MRPPRPTKHDEFLSDRGRAQEPAEVFAQDRDLGGRGGDGRRVPAYERPRGPLEDRGVGRERFPPRSGAASGAMAASRKTTDLKASIIFCPFRVGCRRACQPRRAGKRPTAGALPRNGTECRAY